jgi:paraquat-inducible protein A
MTGEQLLACHECDLLHRIPHVSEGAVVICRRCGAVLFKKKRNSLDRTLALSIAGIALFIVANAFPFLSLEIQGQTQQITLASGIREFHLQGMSGVASLVFLTTILAPILQLVGLTYILLPLKVDRMAPGAFRVFRFLHRIQPWSMMEVFMLGVLVSIVKLAKMAQIVPGIAVYSFMALIFVLAGCTASLDPHLVWERWEKPS